MTSVTDIWNKFINILKDKDIKLSDIEACDSNTFANLLKDLCFNPLETAQIQTTWQKRQTFMQCTPSKNLNNIKNLNNSLDGIEITNECTLVEPHTVEHSNVSVQGNLALNLIGWEVDKIKCINSIGLKKQFESKFREDFTSC